MQTDYFVIMRAGPSSYPLLAWDEYRVGFVRPAPVNVTAPVQLRLGAPVPRTPVMVDYHSLPEPVVSERIKNSLALLDLFGLQLVPADVKVKQDDVRRYWLLHVFNWIACINLQHSACTFYPDGDVLGIDRLVLDEEVLQDIPLERRRVFVLEESPSVYLFHHSVVEHILALQPEGLRFIRVDQWNDSAGFRS
ncbi:hypothetical protein HPC49_30785 [Pyxidicoccus fallax]|uniref:Immunity MXAN-0049 protein domain-containing protein n=1 Tax=Pyxidicoccus fallax TaxID=394095 RepID=A0A848LIZ4_9BACT|nr:DUF1629 domain-containing protein [Pyxidicoccus fallax]NMO17707.1 hypothetical protein [Pyxidicoccus fallax]NPC82596.1 hypothetical protein [Pyxidicoccus fallax]